MKKLFIGLIVIAGCTLATSCNEPKTNKCKCTVKLEDVTLKNQIIFKPEDKKCSKIKVKDLEGKMGSIDFTKVAKIKCEPYVK